MKLARILVASFAVVGVIGWVLLLWVLTQWANAMAGMGDGAGTESRSPSPLQMAVIAAIWLVPTAGFAFMFLNAINALKGTMRRVAYWYSLLFLIIVGCGVVVFHGSPRLHLKIIGLVFLLFAGLWGFAFRESVNQNPASEETVSPP